MTERHTIIPLSKTKMVLMLIGCVAFVAAGAWMLTLQSASGRGLMGNPTMAHLMGGVGIVFFGGIGVFIARKLFDRRPGLVLREDGLVDNSSGVAAGLIPWTDVVGFEVMKVQSTRMLVIRVVDPERYAQRGGAFKRSLNRMNIKLCGSPVVIASNALQVNFDELQRLCVDYRERFGPAQV